MRVVTQLSTGGPEVLELGAADVPAPLPTEIRVRVAAAGVNPVDWKTRAGAGMASVIGPPPFTLGWDVAGTVDATLSLEPVGSIAVALGEAKRAITNPMSLAVYDPFYSGVSLLTTKFIKERPKVAKAFVEALDEATIMAEKNYTSLRTILPAYTAVKPDQVEIVAQPYLRPWTELNETDLTSYQTFVNVFRSEGALKQDFDIKPFILKPSDLS